MISEKFNIQEELKNLPGKPGVYIMYDKKDTIIYVGKAIKLNNRVRSYFRESANHSPKIAKMVSLPPNCNFDAILPQPASLAIDDEYSVR